MPLPTRVMLLALLLAPLMMAPFMLVNAQAKASAKAIDITADELTVQHTQGEATFKGNVKVVRADLTLTSNALTARYAGKSGALQSLIATGNVQLQRGANESASGERAEFNPSANTLTLTGSTVTLKRGPSTLTGDTLVYDLATQAARVTRAGGPVQATFIPQ